LKNQARFAVKTYRISDKVDGVVKSWIMTLCSTWRQN